MNIRALSLFLFVGMGLFHPNPVVGEAVAILRGLDKVTARISLIEAPVQEVVSFGTLAITVFTCVKSPPEELPEVAVFLSISDTQNQGLNDQKFLGWMFASSPALNALEHPVYDVWAIDCKIADPDTLVAIEEK
tara:strand:+ start:77 stop:478 length:402 start_codon:yes stop_codon:yes gene_type:complete